MVPQANRAVHPGEPLVWNWPCNACYWKGIRAWPATLPSTTYTRRLTSTRTFGVWSAYGFPVIPVSWG